MVSKAKRSSKSQGSKPVVANRTANETEAKTNSSGNDSGTKQADSVKKKVENRQEMSKSICEIALSLANDAKLEGNSVYKAGDYDTALLRYELAIKTAPDGPLSNDIRSVCYANRAACFSNMGKFEESVEECTKALELNPTYLKALLRRGEAREKLEHYDEAIADVTQILGFDPSNDQARRNIFHLKNLAAKKREKMMVNTKGVDYISRLHEDILTVILSRLPFDEAVRTSILSKAWEFKWTSLCNVRIDDVDKYHDTRTDMTLNLLGTVLNLSKKTDKAREVTFANFVDRVLWLSKNMTSFRVATRNQCTPSLLTTWISTVLRRKIENFDILLKGKPSYGDKAIVFPFSLLTNPSLQTFEVTLDCTMNLNPMDRFPNLTKLFLQGVRLNGNFNSVVSLNFPVLETFENLQSKWVNVKSVEIHAPVLTRFSTNPSDVIEDYSIKIVAPRLEKFQSGGLLPENIDFDGSPVVAAHFEVEGINSDLDLIRKTGPQLRKQLSGLHSNLDEFLLSKFMATALESGSFPIQPFPKLTRLFISFPCITQKVFEFLHAVPMLKFICIDLADLDDYDYDGNSIPCCIESHLEEVVTSSFKGKLAQTKFLKFLMKNGERLEQIMFLASPMKIHREVEGLSYAERVRVIHLLERLTRKSKSPLRFIFLHPEEIYLVE